ncbi:MAG: hypothetical protein LRZ85_05960 [Alphaproteobacteria bacterium]|nr:hypothetical protein [Alphaproteobacteria bacterium]
MNTKSERFEMRLDPEIIERVDTWRSEQMDIPSRAEAIRRLTEYGLSAYQSHPVKLDDGSKLILVMLSELYEKMNVKGEIEPSFIKSVIYDGQYWALKWQYPGIFLSL